MSGRLRWVGTSRSDRAVGGNPEISVLAGVGLYQGRTMIIRCRRALFGGDVAVSRCVRGWSNIRGLPVGVEAFVVGAVLAVFAAP